MNRETIYRAALGLTVAGSMAGGLAIAEATQDTPGAAVELGFNAIDVARADYLEQAPADTCEQHVLSTMLNINAVNTPKSEELTEAALDNVCPDGEVDHSQLAVNSARSFKAYQDSKDKYYDLKDTSVLESSEILAGIAMPPLLGFTALVVGVAGSSLIKTRKKSV